MYYLHFELCWYTTCFKQTNKYKFQRKKNKGEENKVIHQLHYENPRFSFTQMPKPSLNPATYTFSEHQHATSIPIKDKIKKTGVSLGCKLARESKYHETTVEVTEKVMCAEFSIAVRLLPVPLLVITYGFKSSPFRPHRKMAERISNNEITACKEFLLNHLAIWPYTKIAVWIERIDKDLQMASSGHLA